MRRPLLLVAICLVSVMGLLLHLGVFDRVPDGQISAEALTAGEPLTLTGLVYQKDSEKLYLQSVHIISSADSQPDIPCKDNLICILEQEEDIPLGNIVLITGIFQPFSEAANHGEFDSCKYYRMLGIGGKVKDAVVRGRGESSWRLREALYQLRNLLKQRLEKVFPEKEAAVMSALLLGDKEALDPDLKELYQRNGILHILSISSLHITMIGMTVYKLLRRCRIPVCPAAASGCMLLVLYGMMTGFSVSASRAIGMYLLRMTAEMIGRTYDLPAAMGVTAMVLVIRNPYYLQNTGFLLSFSSMMGIGIIYPAMGNNGRKKCVKERLLEPVLSGISITLGTLPVQLWFYYQVPVYSVLLNILVLPFMKILMAAGFLALIPGLGICGRAGRLILRGYEALCGVFDSFPCHTWNPGKPQLWQVTVYCLLLAASVWGRRYLQDKSRNLQESRGKSLGKCQMECRQDNQAGKYKIGSAVCLAVLLLSPAVFAWQQPPENQILFLDVGQGDGILVRTASGENYLLDGGSSSRSRAGKYILLPCLRYYGIQTLDAVILSHPDADHVNGVMELLSMGQNSGIRIKQLVLPELSEEGKGEMLEQLSRFAEQRDWIDEVPIGYLAAGESFCSDRAEFLCLHPERGWKGTETNAYSVCIYGIFTGKNGEKEFDFLMTGDVENAGEEALLAELHNRGIQGVSVLKVAHHGSKNATSARFLEQVSPVLAVISCGRNNRYGHPHQELLERLDDMECIIITTGEKGEIKVDSEDGMLRVETFK